MKITIEQLKDLNEKSINELFFKDFLDYGKNCSKYIAHNHNMTINYCSSYIASGLYMLYIERLEYLRENNENNLNEYELYLYAFLGTKNLIRKILANTNYSSYFKNNDYAYNNQSETLYKMEKYKKSKNVYSEYRNVKKVNSHILDIVDVLEQKENRANRLAAKHDYYFESETIEFLQSKNTINNYYPSPEQSLLNKLSRFYSRQYADKIRNDKKYFRLLEIEKKIKKNETISNTDNKWLSDFRKKYGLNCLNTSELLYIVNNY